MPAISTMCALKARMQGIGKQTVDTQGSPTETMCVSVRRLLRGYFHSISKSRTDS